MLKGMQGLAPTTRERILHDVERDGKYKGEHGLQVEIEIVDLGGTLSVSLRVCWRKRWRTVACVNTEDALDKFDGFLQEKARTREIGQESLF